MVMEQIGHAYYSSTPMVTMVTSLRNVYFCLDPNHLLAPSKLSGCIVSVVILPFVVAKCYQIKLVASPLGG